MNKLLLLTILYFLASQNIFALGNDLKANVSTTDITPPPEMKYTLGGYGERMNKPAVGIHDRIYAKALVLKKNNRKFALITLDVLGLPANVKKDLIHRLTGLGWKEDNIMLLPSHSHGSLEMEALNSKNTLNIPQLGIYQPELLEFLLKKLIALIKEADKNYQPVKVGTGMQQLEGLNRNRRKDPDVEKNLTVTRFDLLTGKPLAVLVNWTAHPTFIDGTDMLLSAEWPGYLQTELQKMIGNGATVLYYNGAEGDQSAVNDIQADNYKKIELYGKKIAAKAFETYKTIKTQKVFDFNYNYLVLKLPEHQAHPSFMKTGGEEYGMTAETVKIVMNALCPTDVGIGVLRIDDFVLCGVPGELTAALGKEIREAVRKKDVKYVTIGGLANEWISYILTKDQYTNGQGYESSMSFYGPDLGELISKSVIQDTTF